MKTNETTVINIRFFFSSLPTKKKKRKQNTKIGQITHTHTHFEAGTLNKRKKKPQKTKEKQVSPAQRPGAVSFVYLIMISLLRTFLGKLDAFLLLLFFFASMLLMLLLLLLLLLFFHFTPERPGPPSSAGEWKLRKRKSKNKKRKKKEKRTRPPPNGPAPFAGFDFGCVSSARAENESITSSNVITEFTWLFIFFLPFCLLPSFSTEFILGVPSFHWIFAKFVWGTYSLVLLMLPSLPSYFFWTFCLLVREVYRVFSTEFFWRCDSRVTEFLSSIVSHFFFFGGGEFLPSFFFALVYRVFLFF